MRSKIKYFWENHNFGYYLSDLENFVKPLEKYCYEIVFRIFEKIIIQENITKL